MRIRLALLLLLFASVANATVLIDEDWESGWGTWRHSYGQAQIVADATAPSGTNVLRYTLNNGMDTGNSPDIVAKTFATQNELWVRYKFKVSSNWEWPSIADKFVFVWAGTSNNYMGQHNGNNLVFAQQTTWDGSQNFWASEPPVIVPGQWHEIIIHGVVNTGGANDGVAQMWLDGTLVVNTSTIQWRNTGGTGFHDIGLECVWGSPVNTRNNGPYYVYYDDVTVQTTAFGDEGSDTSAPYASQWSPAKSATGVAISNRTITFHIQDDTDVLTSYGTVTIEGTPYTCGSGITCVGNGTTDATITYTKGSDWDYSQTVNVSTSGFRDTAGNVMATDTWSYTTASDPGPSLEVTTTTLPGGTVGDAYSQTVAATGGTSPYTWAVTVGSLPAGLSLSSSGAITGIPTTAGVSTFTVRATDNVSATDSQELSLTIAPNLPGGQTTVVWSANISCAYINGGSPNTNYASEALDRTYQWPIGTAINKIICTTTDPTSLPDNVSVTSATFEAYSTTDYEGSGGTNPMRIYARRITGTIPDVSSVTWNNYSGTTSGYLSVAEVPLTAGWASWDVTSAVQATYAAQDNLALMLEGMNDGAADTNRAFDATLYKITVTFTQLVGEGGPSISAPGKMRISSGKFRRFGGTP